MPGRLQTALRAVWRPAVAPVFARFPRDFPLELPRPGAGCAPRRAVAKLNLSSIPLKYRILQSLILK